MTSALIPHEEAMRQFLLRMGDNTLILGHRISEWCGHSPILEEDIAMANVALDLIGQTQFWLGLAAERGACVKEGHVADADALAFLRDASAFRNVLLVEQPNGDYARTLMRQLLFDAWHWQQLQALEKSNDNGISEIAAKAMKEVSYHLERSSHMVIRLGDGTYDSQQRMQTALDALWSYCGELFADDAVDEALLGVAPLPSSLRDAWLHSVGEICQHATLRLPSAEWNYKAHKGGKQGRHSEHLGHLLATMQFLQRAYPGCVW